MVGFIEGPLILMSFVIFLLGVLFQIYRFFSLTREKERVVLNLETKKQSSPQELGSQVRTLIKLLKRTIFGTHPVVIGVTCLFHILIFIVPIFLLAHQILLEAAWGIRFGSFSESISDALTLLVLLGGLFFLCRRVFLRQVRSITTSYDYLVLLIVLAPFITGFFATHQWFDYRTMIFLHILSGEIMLITLPFTRLGHMIFFFLYRFMIGSEYSFARGTRTW
jgi:nitrate reductase gamma subunit